MLLFRPVGLEELRLVYEADLRAFPPRLPDQPIFYPVTNEGYAMQIAKDWNTQSGTKAGFVTRFSVDDTYIAKFERRVVGAKEHEELWVPAEELGELNARIEGRIEVTQAFFGDDYRGELAKGRDARAQFLALRDLLGKGELDAARLDDHVALFLNFFWWEHSDFSADGLDTSARDRLLAKLRATWPREDVALGVASRRTIP